MWEFTLIGAKRIYQISTVIAEVYLGVATINSDGVKNINGWSDYLCNIHLSGY